MAFQKHRDEREIFAIDLAQRLSVGEILSSPEVTVSLHADDGTWQDKTAEFLTGAATISGTKVQFTLKNAASVGEQPASVRYMVYAKASTNAGRILVCTTNLTVTA